MAARNRVPQVAKPQIATLHGLVEQLLDHFVAGDLLRRVLRTQAHVKKGFGNPRPQLLARLMLGVVQSVVRVMREK